MTLDMIDLKYIDFQNLSSSRAPSPNMSRRSSPASILHRNMLILPLAGIPIKTFQLTHASSPQDCLAGKCFLSPKGFRQYSSQHVLSVPKKSLDVEEQTSNDGNTGMYNVSPGPCTNSFTMLP